MARTIIVICEGAGDKKFLEELISRSGLDEDIQVVECEGKTTFERKLVALKAGSGFDSAAIVMFRDGDTEPEAEIKAARAEFRAIGYELTADPPSLCVAPDGVVFAARGVFRHTGNARTVERMLFAQQGTVTTWAHCAQSVHPDHYA